MSTQLADLIGTAEAARVLKASRTTVLRFVESETLKPAHVANGGPAGIFLFARADVEALAKQRERR